MLPILQRLCWKELRQGWLMLLLGLLLPPLALSLMLDHVELLTFDMPTIALFVLIVGVAVWASMLAKDARGRQSYAGIHFPQHPGLASLVTYLLQGSVALVIGISIGYWRARMGGLYSYDNYPFLGLLYVGSTFAAGYGLTLLFSPPVGMVAGILCGLVNTWTFNALASNQLGFNGQDTVVLYMGMAIILSFFAVLCYLLMLRFSLKTRRVLACVLFGIGLLFIPIKEFVKDNLPQDARMNIPVRLASSDGALVVEAPVIESDSVDLRLVDHRRLRTLTHRFRQAVQPLGFVGKNVVILAQQLKKESRVTLLRWALDSDAVEPFASLPARPEGLTYTLNYYSLASFDPGGRFGIIFVPSPYGGGYWYQDYDLWKIDLQQRSVTMIKPLIRSPSDITGWHGNEAILAMGNMYAVSMATDQMIELPAPLAQEGKE